jgi:hypothetical protein
MGADQSTSLNTATSVAIHALADATTMPHRALLKALEDIELEAEQTSVRKIVIAHPDHVRELTRIIKSCEISRDSKLREHEIVMHHRLCQQAFRVLIRFRIGPKRFGDISHIVPPNVIFFGY